LLTEKNNNPENINLGGGKAENRRHLILAEMQEKHSVSNSYLSEKLNVSVVSIRKDMEFLEKRGLIRRFHGGARLSDSTFPLFDLSYRYMANRTLKQQIAAEAAKLINKPNLCIFIDTGSTNLLLARTVRWDLPVTVVTNSISTITALEGRSNCKVLTLGGMVDYKNKIFLGPWADSQIERFSFDYVFTGADSVSADGFGSNDFVQGELLRKAISRSSASYVLCDSSKTGKRAGSNYAKPSDVTAWITDSKVDMSFVTLFRSINGKIIIAD
jgi:DeoR/GlpR family transcriptional regulator of sugar metabolism